MHLNKGSAKNAERQKKHQNITPDASSLGRRPGGRLELAEAQPRRALGRPQTPGRGRPRPRRDNTQGTKIIEKN